MRDWWHRFWGGVKHDAEALWHGVFAALDATTSWVTNIWHTIVDALDHIYSFARAVVVWSIHFSQAVWHQIDHLYRELRDNVIPWVGRELRRLGHDVAQGLGRALAWAGRELRNLWGQTLHALQWVERNLIGPIARQLKGFVLWVGHTMWRLLFDAIHGVEHFAGILRRDFDNLFHQVGTWFDHTFWSWWRHFTTWGAEFIRFLSSPFEWLGHHLAFLVQRGSGWWMQQLMVGVEKEGGFVEELLARWLGS